MYFQLLFMFKLQEYLGWLQVLVIIITTYTVINYSIVILIVIVNFES